MQGRRRALHGCPWQTAHVFAAHSSCTGMHYTEEVLATGHSLYRALYTTSPPLRLRAQIHPPGGRSLLHKSELCTAAGQARTTSERTADELCTQADMITPAHVVHSSRPHAQAHAGNANPSAPPPHPPGMASRSAQDCTYTLPEPYPKFASKCCTPSHFLWDEQQIKLYMPLPSRPT